MRYNNTLLLIRIPYPGKEGLRRWFRSRLRRRWAIRIPYPGKEGLRPVQACLLPSQGKISEYHIQVKKD